MVGIGCNVASAPSVPDSGPQYGRPATCLADHNPDIASCANNEGNAIGIPPHKALADDIFTGIKSWYQHEADADSNVIRDFESVMYLSEQKLRDSIGPAETILPLGLNEDGTLRVSLLSIFF